MEKQLENNTNGSKYLSKHQRSLLYFINALCMFITIIYVGYELLAIFNNKIYDDVYVNSNNVISWHVIIIDLFYFIIWAILGIYSIRCRIYIYLNQLSYYLCRKMDLQLKNIKCNLYIEYISGLSMILTFISMLNYNDKVLNLLIACSFYILIPILCGFFAEKSQIAIDQLSYNY